MRSGLAAERTETDTRRTESESENHVLPALFQLTATVALRHEHVDDPARRAQGRVVVHLWTTELARRDAVRVLQRDAGEGRAPGWVLDLRDLCCGERRPPSAVLVLQGEQHRGETGRRFEAEDAADVAMPGVPPHQRQGGGCALP
jgi:hypothetical protein